MPETFGSQVAGVTFGLWIMHISQPFGMLECGACLWIAFPMFAKWRGMVLFAKHEFPGNRATNWLPFGQPSGRSQRVNLCAGPLGHSVCR